MTVKLYGAEGSQIQGLKEVGVVETPVPPLKGDVIQIRDLDPKANFRVVAVVHFAPSREYRVIVEHAPHL